MHIDSDDRTTTVETKRLRIVTIFAENLDLLLRQPLVSEPSILNMVDGVILALLAEILDINWPCIMVSLNWEHFDLLITQSVFKHFSQIQSI